MTDAEKAKFREKLLAPFLEIGKNLGLVVKKTALSANASDTLVHEVEAGIHFFPKYIAVKSTGTFDITEIQFNQRNVKYGDDLTNTIFTQYTAFPLPTVGFIPQKGIVKIKVKDTSGAANTITILIIGETIPA